MDISDNQRDLARSMYEHLSQSKGELARERLTLTYIVGAISIGLLAYFKEKFIDPSNLGVIYFLMGISIFALLFTFKIQYVFRKREEAADSIVSAYGLEDFLPKYSGHIISKVSIGKLYPTFFSGCCCGYLYALLRVLSLHHYVASAITIVLFITIAIIIWRQKW